MNYSEAVKRYHDNRTPEALSEVVSALLAEMTVKEKIHMLTGHAMGTTAKGFLRDGRVYNAEPYRAGGCKRLGIPEVAFADGPRGSVPGKSTCFPVSMLRGAAFDDELEYKVGKAIAAEIKAQGANYFAGICINLLRNPLWGRAQETYSEDTYLLGRMGAALTRSVQEEGVIACPKHYALNSIEDLRFSVDAVADERTLFEVYLPHFKKCIDAGALSIMGAYNKVNGTYACENEYLLKTVLRDTWGFDGFTISDFFFGVYDAARSLKAGLDIEMPYTFRYKMLPAYLRSGKVNMTDIDTAVKNILSVLIRILPCAKPQGADCIVSREHTALARTVAEKGTVLLRNNGVLPLKKSTSLAVVGRFADKINVGDHGSSNVYSPYTVTPYEGIASLFDSVSVYSGNSIASAVSAANDADAVVVCVGSDYRDEGEFLVNLGNIKKKPQGAGGDRVSASLCEHDTALIKALSCLGKKLIVNIFGGSAYIIREWVDLSDAVLCSFYSGLEGGNALAAILAGDVNPSGHLPFTVANDESEYPPFLYIEDSTRTIDYGYYHGYTLFDKKGIKPFYPFGFGLSYTSFSFSGMALERGAGETRVTLTVKNSGKRDGETVVQLYAGSADARDDRPVKLLKGFLRVALSSGEEKTVTLCVPDSELMFYDSAKKEWALDKKYTFFAGEDCEKAGKLKKTIKI